MGGTANRPLMSFSMAFFMTPCICVDLIIPHFLDFGRICPQAFSPVKRMLFYYDSANSCQPPSSRMGGSSAITRNRPVVHFGQG